MKRLLALLAALALLTGCTSLPTSGPVHTAEPQIPAGYGIDVLAEGPAQGATPEEIVKGFLRASAYGHTDEFQVALQYLAEGVAWEPLAQVHVFSADDPPQYTVGADGGVTVRVNEVATVDEMGRYRVMDGSELESSFSLVRDTDGQWRIASLPAGLIVSDVNFQATFRAAQLFFLTQDLSASVPEQRWYPLESQVTHLVSGLLAGPSGWMEFGVVSAIPDGTTLDGVTLADGEAVIGLSDAFRAASPQEVALTYAQLESTLENIPEVNSVRLEVAGQAVEKPDFEVALALPQPASTPVVLSAGQVMRYVGGLLQRVPGSPDLTARAPRHPAVPYPDSDAPMVVLGEEGTALLTVPENDDAPVTLLIGENFTPPSYDRYGWVWVAEQNSDGSLTTVRADGTSTILGASWLTGRTVTHLQVAADGARAVIVSRDATQTYVELVGISRDNLGRPRAVGEPLVIAESLQSVLDVAWVDQSSLVVLGAPNPEIDPRVHRVQIGGPISVLPAVEGAVSLASSRSERSVVVATSDGSLFVRSGAGWRNVAAGVLDPAYAG